MDLQKIEHVLALIGVVSPLASALSSKVNQQIREIKSAGDKAPSWLLQLAILLNLFAVNTDKVAQHREELKTEKADA